jgi:esterase/lipase superfamily enzyme
MQRQYHSWHSPALGRTMELLIFGHGGAPMLVFPTSQGRFYEYEDRGMVGALEYQIEAGWFQLICVDSIDAETLYNYGWAPSARLFRYDQYEHYLLTEVLPLVRHLNSTPYLITTGCSLGAYYAMNLALRHPGVVNRVIGLSGHYDVRNFFRGYYGDDLYFHNPVDFVGGVSDQWTLEQYRRMDIIMATGRDDQFAWSNHKLSSELWNKGVGNALRVWNGWYHDWPYWRDMISRYIGGHD